MVKLNHEEWIVSEFKRDSYFTKINFRSTLVHAIIVQGIVTKHGDGRDFTSSILSLYLKDDLVEKEARLLKDINVLRNTLMHGLFEKKGMTQTEIDDTRDKLMESIIELYKTSQFFQDNLFAAYGISLFMPITLSVRVNVPRSL